MKIKVKSRDDLIKDTNLKGGDLNDIAKYSGEIFECEVIEDGSYYHGSYLVTRENGSEGIFMKNEVEVYGT